jgi:hypothetical protein
MQQKQQHCPATHDRLGLLLLLPQQQQQQQQAMPTPRQQHTLIGLTNTDGPQVPQHTL